METPREVQNREIQATFKEGLGGQLGGDAGDVSTDPAGAGNSRGIDRKADRARNRNLLIVRRAARIADRPVPRLRTGFGVAVPLVELVRRRASAARKVDRNQEVTFRAMAAEVARAAGSEADDRLQELEVDVTVAVVAQPLSAEEEFGTGRGGMAYGIDIAQVVFIRNVSGTERHPVDVVAILDRCGEGGGIVRRTAGRCVRGERINDDSARDEGRVRRASRSDRQIAGRCASASVWRS